jgi:hypothetical protein
VTTARSAGCPDRTQGDPARILQDAAAARDACQIKLCDDPFERGVLDGLQLA